MVRGALRRRGGGGIGQGQAAKASQGQVQDDKCKAADGPAQQAKVGQQGPSSEVTLTACKVYEETRAVCALYGDVFHSVRVYV